MNFIFLSHFREFNINWKLDIWQNETLKFEKQYVKMMAKVKLLCREHDYLVFVLRITETEFLGFT